LQPKWSRSCRDLPEDGKTPVVSHQVTIALISKEGDPYLRTLLVQGAHHILGPSGRDLAGASYEEEFLPISC